MDPGLGSPFASGSGTCDPAVGSTTFFVQHISGDHPDPIAELTTDGPATLEAYPTDVDTGGAGSVWGALGYPLNQGDAANVQIFCSGSAATVGYSIALYDAPTAPASVSGAATTCPSCSSTNEVQFWAPATATYYVSLTLTQGSVDLSNGQTDQVFTSSGNFLLGNFGDRHSAVYLTPLAGPTADWTLSIQALPVKVTQLRFPAPYIPRNQATIVSYHVDGDVTLSASIKDSSGAVVETLATSDSVKAGDHTLQWDGLDQGGTPVADGTYTAALTYTDAEGNSGSAKASVVVDGTPPAVTAVSLPRISASTNLVLDVHDALSGLAGATLTIDNGAVVQSLGSDGTQFVYQPLVFGWSKGQHTWHVTATDNVGNTGVTSGTFTVGSLTPPLCRVPKLIG
ncbi:MAG TPA: FlgD immunoglobulin-like domain containing protein, partial [Gaiellaceae bacterium]|nr:FlgD immunoglobulin-like domain containing protein [Gaiellaceae bacterium]